jgi:deoxycytidylate deaminase
MSARPVSVEDLRYMDVALALAYARLGATAPNPSVGCVIVKDGRIIGAAATAPGGAPMPNPRRWRRRARRRRARASMFRWSHAPITARRHPAPRP